jgi:hypothetical protein
MKLLFYIHHPNANLLTSVISAKTPLTSVTPTKVGAQTSSILGV